MHQLLQQLTGGDRRSIGNVEDVIRDVKATPALFGVLLDGLAANDPLVRMRSADAIEKISAHQPELLQPFKKLIIRLAGQTRQQEVRWHVAQIIPRLALTIREKSRVADILFDYLDDGSKIVITFSLQALSDLAIEDKRLRPRVVQVFKEFTASGSPAIKSRGRKLLDKISRL